MWRYTFQWNRHLLVWVSFGFMNPVSQTVSQSVTRHHSISSLYVTAQLHLLYQSASAINTLHSPVHVSNPSVIKLVRNLINSSVPTSQTVVNYVICRRQYLNFNLPLLTSLSNQHCQTFWNCCLTSNVPCDLTKCILLSADVSEKTVISRSYIYIQTKGAQFPGIRSTLATKFYTVAPQYGT